MKGEGQEGLGGQRGQRWLNCGLMFLINVVKV